MSGDLDLEQRYRRVLRLLPGYYRDKWEEDMVAAFLDSWMTGDPDEDSVTMEYDRPSRQEIASVVGLAARLYLGGAGTPRRYFAWGQAVRLAVLAVVLVHATQGLSLLTLLTWRRHLAGWFPALPASLAGPVPSGAWPTGSPASPSAGLVRLTGGAGDGWYGRRVRAQPCLEEPGGVADIGGHQFADPRRCVRAV